MQKQMKKTLALIMAIIMTVACSPIIGINCGFQSNAASYKVGDIISFGSYPQSKVTDSKTLSALNKLSLKWVSYGYYEQNKKNDFMKYADVTYNSNKYRAVKFTKYRPGYARGEFITLENNPSQYENGYKVNTVYWFKFEPLKWKILDTKTGLVMSESLIDSKEYNIRSDEKSGVDYESSMIRKWLNNDFYNITFSKTEKTKIITTTVDNIYYNSEWEKENKKTKDKIYLLSYEDIINEKYGFNSGEYFEDKARQANGTDYAKCQGLQIYKDTNHSCWWLREISEVSPYMCPVSPYGYLDGGFMFSYDVTSIGTRPAMCIDLTSAPAQVKGLKAASKTSSTVTLSWSKASGAQKYEIFKYNQSTKKYTSLGTTTSTSFKISNLLSNTKYMFAVSAYKTTNGNKMSGKKSALLTVTTSKMGTPSQVKGLKATQTASTISLSWNKVGGSDIKYYIYSYNPNAKSKYKQIGVTTSNKFTVKKLKSGTTYRYAVRAFGVPNKKWGKMSAVLTTATSPAAVTLKVTSGTQQAKLTWSKATGATGYEIFIATSKSGKYKKLASTKSINYTAKNLEKGKTYYFKVRAYKSINKINIYSSYSAVNSIKIK